MAQSVPTMSTGASRHLLKSLPCISEKIGGGLLRVQVAPSLARIGIPAHTAVLTTSVVSGGRGAQWK